MKEILRQYGASVIAAVVGIVLILVIAALPVGSLAVNSSALSSGDGYKQFESYWRSR